MDVHRTIAPAAVPSLKVVGIVQPVNRRKFFIDTDTATDDAVALLIALTQPDIDVLGLSIVAGNCPAPSATQNALYTCELLGKKIPVHVGAARPLMRELETAQHVHGVDGMGDIGLSLTGRTPTSYHGVQAIIDVIMNNPGEIELVTLGPLTNLALAIQLEPRIVTNVKRVVVMGGTAVLPGNITPLAEFNFWVDPEAAHIVVNSGIYFEMAGWDISVAHAVIDDDLAAELRTLGPLGEFAIDIQKVLRQFCIESSQLAGFDLPDPIAMAIAIDPSIATKEASLYVDVIPGDGPARGQTVVDSLNNLKRKPNCRVIYQADRERFISLLKSSLSQKK